jgi:hypothetical protein
MCKFFSVISDGNGTPYYFNWEQRKKILAKDPAFNMVETADSHSSISSFYGFTGEKADQVNKFEYNPLTGLFEVDQINTTDDKCLIEKWCREVDFKTIVEPFIIKKIINPLTDIKAKKVTKKDLMLLQEWDSVVDSVWASVWASVSTYFDIKYTHNFAASQKLWDRGLVPSFDGKKWRLHAGKDAKVVWEGTVKDIELALGGRA